MEFEFMEYYSYLDEQDNRNLRSDEMAKLNAVNRKLRHMVMGTSDGNVQECESCLELVECGDEREFKKLQVEMVELRRLTKELQHQKRHLNMELSTAQAQVSALLAQNAKVEAEAAALRHGNEELTRQVERLQNNRFSEVEELVYLRWVNACLRYELRKPEARSSTDVRAMELSKDLSPRSQDRAKNLMLEYAGSELLALRSSRRFDSDHDDSASSQATTSTCSELSGEFVMSLQEAEALSNKLNVKKPGLIKKFKETWRRNKPNDSSSGIRRLWELEDPDADSRGVLCEKSGNTIAESFQIMSRSVDTGEVADKYPSFKDRHKLQDEQMVDKQMHGETDQGTENRPARKAEAPPRFPSSTKVETDRGEPTTLPPSITSTPPPPPPPLPPPVAFAKTKASPKFRRAPQVIELYQSMMKRESHSKTTEPSSCSLADARSNMIEEIEKRSSYLLAIKSDVQTQGEFVESLAAEIRKAEYKEMDGVVAFVNWLDNELSFLVDERAVLKHFNWPEAKADALRESAFEYQNLKKLEQQVASFEDEHRIKRDAAMKKMQGLLERIEQNIYRFLRTRDLAACRYKEFRIPTDWMLDSGMVAKMKQSSVKLAERFIKRVISELHAAENELVKEFLVLQGVRFAFRVHQFAGGFDEESMRAFEELRSHARSDACRKQS